MSDVRKCLDADFDRYSKRLWGLARKLMRDEGDIEDLVQETFAHALDKESAIGSVDGDLFGILSRILYHKFLDIVDVKRPTKKIYRPGDRRTEHYEDFQVFQPHTKATQETNVFARQVLHAVKNLNAAYMRALVQAGMGFTIGEIAAAEGISHKAAMNRLKQGRSKLRERLNLRYMPVRRKYRGVTKHGRKWRVGLRHDGIWLRLGSFENEEAAAEAFDLAAFSIGRRDKELNFPERINRLPLMIEALL